MTVEQALEELKRCADEFAMMQDSINNHEKFLNSFGKVYDYFEYITNNTENDPNEAEFDDRWLEACDIVDNISRKNPNLEKWSEKIMTLSGKDDNISTEKSFLEKIADQISSFNGN